MSICPLTEDTHCPYCGMGLIGKIVNCDLKNSEDYVEGLVIITTYICFEVPNHNSPRNKGLLTMKNNRLAHHKIE